MDALFVCVLAPLSIDRVDRIETDTVDRKTNETSSRWTKDTYDDGVGPTVGPNRRKSCCRSEGWQDVSLMG